MILDYAPGMSLTDPWVLTSNRGGSPGYFIDSTGKLVQAAANVLRDRHYPFGLGSTVRTTLLDASSTNYCIQSQAWATSWGNNQQTPTNNAAAAPDATTTATHLVPIAGSRPTINPYTQSSAVTITANEYLAASILIKQEGTYTGLQFYLSDAPSTNGLSVKINLATGGVVAAGAIGTGAFGGVQVIPLAGGWYWIGVWGQISTATPGATSAFILTAIYPDATFSGTATYDGTTGYFGWGAQIERFGTSFRGVPTSYVPTTTIAVGRNVDLVTAPWPTTFPTHTFWYYSKHVDLGLAWRNVGGLSAFDNPFILADAANDQPRRRVMWGNAGPQVISEVRASPLYLSDSIAAGVTSSITPFVSVVETFGRWFADNHVETQCSVNGGAVVTGSDSGGLGENYDVNAATAVLLQLRGGSVGLQRLKIGFGTAPITTLAQAAAA